MYLLANWTVMIVAWWGAVIATLVLLWDIYKWRTTGPRISLEVRPNMRVSGEPELEGKPLIIVHATNTGDRPTTLEGLYFVWYSNLWQWMWNKPAANYLIKNPFRGHSFPSKLEVGERRDGIVHQADEYAELGRNGYLYCQLKHASQERPVSKRVRIPLDKERPEGN